MSPELIGALMLKVLGCIAYAHDLRLVALSAVICVLGCLTTASLLARAQNPEQAGSRRWLALAAIVFGSSVWSLHFVAMLAFVPTEHATYGGALTALSALVASAGAYAAFRMWGSAWSRPIRVVLAGSTVALALTGMHYVGVAALTVSSFVSYDATYVAASVAVSLLFSLVAFARVGDLRQPSRRLELCAWFSLAICGVHYTGMTAVTLTPFAPVGQSAGWLDATTLAIFLGGVSVAILIASLVAIMLDQHLSHRSQRELDRMWLMTNLAQEGILIMRDGIVLEINHAGERLLRASLDQVVGNPLVSFFSAESVPALLRRQRCSPAERHPEEVDVQHVDGSRITVELSCEQVEYMGKMATVVALRDLTGRKRDEARIRHLARHDSLTDLPNRYTLLERLDVALALAAQHDDVLALVFIDLDRFKPVNDTHGHAAGDALLQQVAARFKAELQQGDTLARNGGDEFVMILKGAPQPERASQVAARIVQTLREPFLIDATHIEIGASVGISLYPDDGTTADALMRAADIAMYRVKEAGGRSLRFYEASMNAQLQARLSMQQELTGAIARGELILYYQPIVNAGTGDLENLEALIRWHHPTRGMVSPAEFIPLAEQTGLIDQIGRWVLETACREAAQWERPWPVAVNVSPKQFQQSDLCSVVASSLAASALHPARLVIEVTESILIDDAATAVETLNCLRDMGVRVALDDFGTGYSSLSYLQLFKFDHLKIDRSFIDRLVENRDALTLTRSIVNLGHNLGLQVTAEGVETPAQLAILQQLGCDKIQGHLIGRPALIEAFERDRARIRVLFDERHLVLSA